MHRDFADRLYLALLRLYPAVFRARFADEMLALFRDRHDRARGARRLGAFWIATIGDGLRGAAQAHAASPPRLVGAMRLSSVGGDVLAAVRAVVRSPAAPAAMMLLTALTIGTATTVFSLADAVLLTPPPFPNPDRLVMIWERREQRANNSAVSGHEFPVWRERAKAFDALAAYIYAGAGTTLTGAGEPLALIGVRVTGSFFDVFDADPIVGRRFRAEDDVPGAPPVAIISHSLWRERFAGDRDVLGRAIRISDVPHTVVGVAPEGFAYPAMAGRGPDLWTPIAEPIRLYRGRHYLYVVGRMRDGIALRDAQADLASVADALAGELPDDNKGHGVIVRSLAEQLTMQARPGVIALVSSVALLAVVGCLNLAGLGATRTSALGAAYMLRLALGASRARLMRQLATETLVIAGAGTLAGIVLAVWAVRVLPRVLPPGILTTQMGIDATVAAGLTLLAAVAALAIWIGSIAQLPSSAGTGSFHASQTGARAPRRLTPTLVVAEIAFTVALLGVASLLVAHWQRLGRVPVGFNTAGIVTADIALSAQRYADPLEQRQFFDELVAELRRTPNVQRVTTSNLLPLIGSQSSVALTIEGQPTPRRGQEPNVPYQSVGVDYFTTLGIPVIKGRTFVEADARLAVPLIRWYAQQPRSPYEDRPQPMPVAVINQAMAERLWPNEDPLGRRFAIVQGPMTTVIGVVGNTRMLTRERPVVPELFLFSGQEPYNRVNVLLQAAPLDLDALGRRIRAVVRALDADVPVIGIDVLEDVTASELSKPRLTSLVTSVFALASVTLMACGLYALIALTTSLRTLEIGIRMALGARPGSIGWLVLGRTAALAAAGIALGLALWFPLISVLRTQIESFDVELSGPLPLGIAVVIVLATAMAAGVVPLRRALRIDPAISLRP
ncbi:MAG TPA: ADOP family duplicated permease [Vicinamibacterales bacterium]|nr:ADOP family duplicated permease [Vicinamibacterales bacterium]